jgi:hypothetical protein
MMYNRGTVSYLNAADRAERSLWGSSHEWFIISTSATTTRPSSVDSFDS